jgi:murein tripeptide amidase MpaA
MAQYSVRIVAQTLQQLRALDQFDLDIHHRAARQEGPDRFVMPGVLSEEQIKQVEAAGYKVEVIEDLTKVAPERQKELSPMDRFADVRQASELDERARAVQGYMTSEEVESALRALSTAYSDLVTLIELPHQTWEGRRCYAVRLKAGNTPNPVGVMFTGSMHAREWGGSDICVSFTSNLLSAYRNNADLKYGGKTFTAAQVRNLLKKLEIFVFPNVNPDGKNYSQTHDPGSTQSTWWRKNRNPNAGATAKGVDLNRNFDFLWKSGIGTSGDPSSFTYKGKSAFSEPEARNVRHLLDKYPHIKYYVDIHCHGELILYPWGDDNNQNAIPTQNFRNPTFDNVRGQLGDTVYREFIPTDAQQSLLALATRMNNALKAVRGKSYTVQQSVGLYPTSATSDDYAFSRHLVDQTKNRVYSFTIEFGQEFVPPYAEMKKIISDICAAITEFCLAAGS